MNYQEIINAALGYSDRGGSVELPPLLDSMLRMVESRINRALQTSQMSKRAYIYTDDTRQQYGLPTDFGGMRHITLKHNTSDHHGKPVEYATPDYLNRYQATGANVPYCYTIVGNAFTLYPNPSGQVLEIAYYQRVCPLTPEHPTNWISDRTPDVYVQGLLVEIHSFVRDTEGAAEWDARFTRTLDELELEDAKDRWSGALPTVRLM